MYQNNLYSFPIRKEKFTIQKRYKNFILFCFNEQIAIMDPAMEFSVVASRHLERLEDRMQVQEWLRANEEDFFHDEMNILTQAVFLKFVRQAPLGWKRFTNYPTWVIHSIINSCPWLYKSASTRQCRSAGRVAPNTDLSDDGVQLQVSISDSCTWLGWEDANYYKTNHSYILGYIDCKPCRVASDDVKVLFVLSPSHEVLYISIKPGRWLCRVTTPILIKDRVVKTYKQTNLAT